MRRKKIKGGVIGHEKNEEEEEQEEDESIERLRSKIRDYVSLKLLELGNHSYIIDEQVNEIMELLPYINENDVAEDIFNLIEVMNQRAEAYELNLEYMMQPLGPNERMDIPIGVPINDIEDVEYPPILNAYPSSRNSPTELPQARYYMPYDIQRAMINHNFGLDPLINPYDGEPELIPKRDPGGTGMKKKVLINRKYYRRI
jgi:hypothetical protein